MEHSSLQTSEISFSEEGLQFLASGRVVTAIDRFEKELRQNPESEEGHLGLAQSLRSAGMHREAAKVLARGITLHSNSIRLHQRALEAYVAIGEFSKALDMARVCKSMLEAVGHDTSQVSIECEILDWLRYERGDQAIRILLARYRKEPKLGWYVYRWVYEALKAMGRSQSAIQACGKGLMEKALGSEFIKVSQAVGGDLAELEKQGRVSCETVPMTAQHAAARLPSSRSVGGYVPTVFQSKLPREGKAAKIYSVEMGRAYTHQCGASIFSADGKFLSELSMGDAKLFADVASETAFHHIPGRVLFLADPFSDSFFHWMFETLPQVGVLKASSRGLAQIDRIYVRRAQPHHIAVLQKLGIDADKIVSAETVGHAISADTLVRVPDMMLEYPHFEIKPWILEFLRKEFLGEAAANLQAKIFIHRKGYYGREILNEEALLELLKANGFQIVEPETMSFENQVALFKNAKAIIGATGAAMTNLAFASKGAKVMLFYPPAADWQVYWTLCGHLGVEHFHQLGQVVENPWTLTPDWIQIDDNRNYFVDLVSVKRFIEKLDS